MFLLLSKFVFYGFMASSMAIDGSWSQNKISPWRLHGKPVENYDWNWTSGEIAYGKQAVNVKNRFWNFREKYHGYGTKKIGPNHTRIIDLVIYFTFQPVISKLGSRIFHRPNHGLRPLAWICIFHFGNSGQAGLVGWYFGGWSVTIAPVTQLFFVFETQKFAM